MLTLLPPKEKKEIKKEYHTRLAVVSLAFLCALGIIAIVSLLPSYFYEKGNVSQVSKKANAPALSASSSEAISKSHDLKAVLSYIDSHTSTSSLSAVDAISRVLDKKTSAIAIDDIQWSGKAMGVIGTSKTREDLISFWNSFKTDPYFKSADLPISDIAKSTDDNFTLQLELK